MAKKQRKNQPQVRKATRPTVVHPDELTDDTAHQQTREELWATLRQGARNVAGVSYQVAVTAHLLIEGRIGVVDLAQVTPEGFEDIDCTRSDGSVTLVQVKERGAGAGRLTASDVAKAIAHGVEAHLMVQNRSFVMVTDGSLGSRLKFTGWDATIADVSPSVVTELKDGLEREGIPQDQIEGLIKNTSLVHLPWNLRDSSEQLLRDELELHPTIASLVVSELHHLLQQIAAAQRTTNHQDSRSIRTADIDSLISKLQATVDTAGLDAAVSDGVCGPADFSTDSSLRPDQFYLGVDGAPGHIAAGLDVLRPTEMNQMIEAAADERYALVYGPSGCGKSVLLWRAARDAVLGSRVVRVRRVTSNDDVDLLLRHVQLTKPTQLSPIIVVADNLGRPHMERWPDAVDRLRELSSVIIFGACRAEDFHPQLIRGAARLVHPKLDEATANEIAEALSTSGLHQAMAPSEALPLADGLLMEYLALLLSGKRLERILAEQVAGLSDPARRLQRSAARLIATAHSLGFSLPANELAKTLTPSDPPDTVGDALDVLRDEHMITADGTSWRGLHELRSRVLAELLHQSPPPTFGDTLCSVAECLTMRESSWLLRRTAERYPQWTTDVAKALAAHIAHPETRDTEAIAEVLEGAERADNILYAQECLPILQQHHPEGIAVLQCTALVYGIRHQGLYRGAADEQTRRIKEVFCPITQAMPDRSDEILSRVLSGSTPERITSLITASDLQNAVRLLEATASTKNVLHVNDVRRIISSVPEPNDRASSAQWARLIEALYHHLTVENVKPVLGDMTYRATMIARTEPWAIDCTTDPYGPCVTLLQAFTDESITEGLGWEPSRSVSQDPTEAICLALARRLASACPEAKIIKVRTITPSGRPLQVDGHDYASRQIPRSGFPNRTGVRHNVGFQAAIRLLSSAQTWTEILNEQTRFALRLTDLVASAAKRFSPYDNKNRRDDWSQQVNELNLNASLLKPPPTTARDEGLPESHAKADAAQRDADPVAVALEATAQALSLIASNRNRAGVAMSLDEAAKKLCEARRASAPILPELGEPIPEQLIRQVTQLAQLAAAGHQQPSSLRHVNLGSPQEVKAFIERVFAEQREDQRQLLTETFADLPGNTIFVFPDPTPKRTIVNDVAALITVPYSSWGTAIGLVTSLGESFRERLQASVIIAPLVQEAIHADGIRLRHYGSPTFYPADPDSTRSFAHIAGIQHTSTQPHHQWLQLVNELVEISWLTQLQQRRPETWMIPDEFHAPDLTRTFARLDKLRSGLPTVDLDELDQSLGVLLHQMTLEQGDATDRNLAGLVSDALTPSPPEAPQELQVLAAISVLTSVDASS